MDAREPVFKLLHTAFKIDVEPFDILLRALAFVATPLVARHFLPRGWHFAKSDPSKRESTILTSPPPRHIAHRFGCPGADTIDFKEKLN
jgi:hypothetical protein